MRASTLYGTQDYASLRDHLIAKVSEAPLDRDPFCHSYLEETFPPALYPKLLANFPPPDLYSPLNLRKWVRPDGTSTRDLFYFTPENLAKLPGEVATLWKSVLNALTDGHFKRALFAHLAPDMAERFGTTEDRVPDLECVYDLSLVRDTEDYRIKPHPDGLNNLVTMQFYLPKDESDLRPRYFGISPPQELPGRHLRGGQALPVQAEQRVCLCRIRLTCADKLAWS